MTDSNDAQPENGGGSDSPHMLWIASTRDRFDYHEGPFPNQRAAMDAAEKEAMTSLEWTPEPNSPAITSDTHGWQYRIYPEGQP